MGKFNREERYIVVKRKRITKSQEMALREFPEELGIPTEECVIVEPDWPIYEHVWKMVEAIGVDL